MKAKPPFLCLKPGFDLALGKMLLTGVGTAPLSIVININYYKNFLVKKRLKVLSKKYFTSKEFQNFNQKLKQKAPNLRTNKVRSPKLEDGSKLEAWNASELRSWRTRSQVTELEESDGKVKIFRTAGQEFQNYAGRKFQNCKKDE